MSESVRQSEMLYEQREAHLGMLSGDALRDIARNESAPYRWRKAAVKMMLEKNFPQVKHPDLYLLVMDVKADQEAHSEVESVVESAIESQIPTLGKQVVDAAKVEFHTKEVPATLPAHSGSVLVVKPEEPKELKASVTTKTLQQDEKE